MESTAKRNPKRQRRSRSEPPAHLVTPIHLVTPTGNLSPLATVARRPSRTFVDRRQHHTIAASTLRFESAPKRFG
eukprot:1195331-Prorocentrum_minimum.AAC.1